MNKRFYLLILTTLVAYTASAYDFMVDGLCFNKNADGTSVTVTYQKSSTPRYSSLSGDVTIPESVTYNEKTYTVTAISSEAFRGCSELTGISIPNTITSIDGYVFYGCTGLTNVNIPNSITSLGIFAFYNCNGLKNVTWNAKYCNDFTSSVYAPFSGLKSINSFTFGDDVERIPSFLCNGLSELTSVSIPESVTAIGDQAFAGCTGITELTWNAVECHTNGNMPTNNIEHVTIGDEVKNIARKLCERLKNHSCHNP